ncbi:hypothetical protein [Flavihumibacter sp. UBA7668]|uniref:hypothetical protein n=1 Tax=Flavihumibacter sp. UBA7668 TaxID=1946542 RepID=UPI0025BC65AF|nr:hypothetical protein [Flavihumibacter sp. UBA7668]
MLHFYPKPVGILLGICLLACSKSGESSDFKPLFKEATGVLLASDFPAEVSGIADSYSQPGSIWMIEDSHNGAVLLQVGHDGALKDPVELPGATNRDWEDLAIGAGPDQDRKYLYIAETGDNARQHNEYAIYRLEEPAAGVTTVQNLVKIRFTYGDGASHNTEAVLVDPATKDILLITKEKPASIYVLRYPYSTNEINIAESAGATKLETVTGAAIGQDGQELLLRTYTGISYWKRNAGESPADALIRAPVSISAPMEPQGEAIAFRKDLGGFFTLSENAGLPVQLRLFFYQRN